MIPCATSTEVAFFNSSSDGPSKTENSEPKFFTSLSYSALTGTLETVECITSAIISCRGTRLLYGIAFSGLYPSGWVASSWMRLRTPMVSGRWHLGQRLSVFFDSSGGSDTPQSRWPSKWYLPSSGKNSMVYKNFFGSFSFIALAISK